MYAIVIKYCLETFSIIFKTAKEFAEYVWSPINLAYYFGSFEMSRWNLVRYIVFTVSSSLKSRIIITISKFL